MFEIELRNILMTVSELMDKVFMNTAPEMTESPYCVYTMTGNDPEYILNGTTGNSSFLFDINIYSNDLIKLKTMAYQIKTKLLDLLGTTQGSFYIQKVNVHMRDLYDSNVELHRAIIELEIYI